MEKIEITVNGDIKEYTEDITGFRLIEDYNQKNIICIKVNGKYVMPDVRINKSANIEFISYANTYGNRIYVNGLKFILIMATKKILGNDANPIFCSSIDKGIFVKIKSNTTVDKEKLIEIKKEMLNIIKSDYHFESLGVIKKDLASYYTKTKQFEKARNLNNSIGNYANINKCDKYYGYFYGKLPLSTSYIEKFDFTFIQDNTLVLRFPVPRGDFEVPPYTYRKKIVDIINNYENWGEKLKVSFVGDINEIISNGTIKEFIMINELNQNKRLAQISDTIKENKDTKKIILIAGPSSSGKTTTSNKLCVYLKELGLNPHLISTDDYFLNLSETPKNDKGEYDFESIHSIDLNLFNTDISNLLSGIEVEIPTFNFKKGEKEYLGKKISLKENDILLIEGLHALNEELTQSINRNNKYKIYVSPFTPLSVDTYNYISATDSRLIRRIIRDHRTRGFNIENTLKQWENVRAGEEKYVFPFQDEADMAFNTAFIYEIGVIKVYIEPLLNTIIEDSPYYEDAKRLKKLISSFLPIPSEYIPKDSILREFIGGSSFYD